MENIKENDVFYCSYTPKYMRKHGSDELYNCFEGLVIAKIVNDEMMLYDTFWNISFLSCNKKFPLSDINKIITLDYYCNLNDLIKINKDDTKYYNDEDIKILHEQHSCMEKCIHYYIKKDAKKSKDKMLSYSLEKIKFNNHQIHYFTNQNEHINNVIEMLSNNENVIIDY